MMTHRVHSGGPRAVAFALAAIAWTACTGLNAQPPQPASSGFHLYVGNAATTSGGVRQYALPISAGAVPNFAITTSPQVTSVAVNPGASADLAVGRAGGQIALFAPPWSALSAPSLTFANGTATKVGQIFFDGNAMFAATGAGYVNRFTAPFGSAPVAITDPLMDQSFGVMRDAAGVVYVAGVTSLPAGGSTIFRIPPSGPSFITAVKFGCIYGTIAVIGSQLFVPCLDDSGLSVPGRVDVYTLPLAAGVNPAFSITNGVNGPTTLAADLSGNLYVANSLNATVTLYQPPFSAASPAVVTLPITSYQVFAIAIGP